ncbi:acyl-homoserine-lactone synthase [Salinarimonas soli]|nr:acyl-homoserine-lactone synthase [Salinarimonas soli]
MLLLIDCHNHHRHGALLEKAYRFRHRHFVDRLKWEALRKPDGREIDQFDGPDCVHVIGVENDEVASYVRLLPTTRPHLQSHVYPEILQGAQAPTGPGIYEWTRGSVDPNKRDGSTGIDRTTAGFWLGVAEAAEHLGLDGLLVQSHPMMMGRILELGWQVKPLALPTTYDGAPIVSYYAGMSPKTLPKLRATFGISHPLLVIEDRAPAAPGAPTRPRYPS